MTDLRTEIESLIHNGLLPDREYVSAKRFINHYANTNEFWAGLALVGIT
ncbi:TPA: lpg0518 family Dot/Icm T4SS effector, partial [Legionella pneumophila]